MQILANALPGFRDLRAPVIAGYMWLLFAWLWIQPDPDRRPHNPIGAALYDLAQDVNQIWVGLAVGVAAYLVGSVSGAVSNFVKNLTLVFSAVWSLSSTQEEALLPPITRARALLEAAQPRLTAQRFAHLEGLLERRAEAARDEVRRELDLPAILLVGDQPELFAEVDRLRSEGELRTAVSLPLVAIAVLCAFEVSFWWLLMLPAIWILFQQGIAKGHDARTSIANAIRLGKATSVAPTRFSDWVEHNFTEMLAEAGQPESDESDHRLTLRERLLGFGSWD